MKSFMTCLTAIAWIALVMTVMGQSMPRVRCPCGPCRAERLQDRIAMAGHIHMAKAINGAH